MKRERAGNSDTLMHIRGADNPAANNPKNPDFREKKKGGGGGREKFIQGLREREEEEEEEKRLNGKGVIDVDTEC